MTLIQKLTLLCLSVFLVSCATSQHNNIASDTLLPQDLLGPWQVKSTQNRLSKTDVIVLFPNKTGVRHLSSFSAKATSEKTEFFIWDVDKEQKTLTKQVYEVQTFLNGKAQRKQKSNDTKIFQAEVLRPRNQLPIVQLQNDQQKETYIKLNDQELQRLLQNSQNVPVVIRQ
ncbi:hypothetical protein [Ignatzschineria sp. LJL83]